MLGKSRAFSTYSVKDLGEAKRFYQDKLGLEVNDGPMGLTIKTAGPEIFLYEKSNHAPASFTVLNFPVDDIDAVVSGLKDKGVEFESYDDDMIKTDENNIARGKKSGEGPDIAWFKDPAGNVLAILCNQVLPAAFDSNSFPD